MDNKKRKKEFRKILITGNEAIAEGALSAAVIFMPAIRLLPKMSL